MPNDAELDRALRAVILQFAAETGTLHLIEDGLLVLRAIVGDFPPPVMDAIRAIPVGKGMAGLAAERREPVTVCNLQTDASGDVRPGAKATGMEGAIAVPMISSRLMKNPIRAAGDPDEPSAASPRLAVFGGYGNAASPCIWPVGIALASKRVLHQPASNGRLVGTLGIANRNPRTWTEEESALLVAEGRRIADMIVLESSMSAKRW